MTIAKICLFVILSSVLVAACGSEAKSDKGKSKKSEKVAVQNSAFDTPRVVGKIQSSEISESSGVAVSACQSNVLWTHNDGGNDDLIFAIAPSGELLGTYRVRGVKNDDWEDIAGYKDATGKCFVYIGDIGDNAAEKAEHKVYRIPEPPVGGTDPKRTVETEAPLTVRFRYPDENQNAETLMVHPQTGDIYVATKRKSGPSRVYKIKPAFDADIQTAEKVGEISVPAIPNGLLTGGDISPDGRHVMLCDYTQGYELTLPEGAANFDDVWQQSPAPVDLGKRPHGESVGYSPDGTGVYATSEEDKAPIIEVRRRQ